VPNTAVDMNSRAVLACYPRGNFYPLIPGPSIQSQRVTRTSFRFCLICQSHSQAGLCPYTQRWISNPPEPTFARLRYTLGGDRPSQTAHLALFSICSSQIQVRIPSQRGWYPTVGSTDPSEPVSKPPTYSVHAAPRPNTKLQ
jgi:hypothetical protein